MNFEELTPEMQAKARACTTAEEVLKLAEDEGRELSEDELDSISGGKVPWYVGNGFVCPRCKGHNTRVTAGREKFVCDDCGYEATDGNRS